MLLCHVCSVFLVTAILPSTAEITQRRDEKSCDACCQGPSGIPGLPGSHGHNGMPGRDGLRGEKGDFGVSLKGDKGDRGSVGDQGPIGPEGHVGQKGDANHVLTRKSAFTATKMYSQYGDIGEVVTFHETATNINNHFSLETSKFTCHFPGTYMFMFTIAVGRDSDPIISLVTNGNVILSAGTRTATDSSLGQGSNSAILNLYRGDKVWLKFNYHSGRRLYSNELKLTSFSGVLVYDF